MIQRPRVLIAEDYPIFALGLRQALGDDYEILAVVQEGTAVIPATARYRPTILLLDFSMPGLSGIPLIRAVCKEGPRTRVLVISSLADPAVADAALQNGADGFVARGVEPPELVAAVEGVLRGKRVRSLGPTWHLAERKRARVAAASRLTPRLRQVLALIGEGKSTKEIAARLGISSRTVDHHRREVYRRTGVRHPSTLHHLAVEYVQSLKP